MLWAGKYGRVVIVPNKLVGGAYLIRVDLTMMSERKNGDRPEGRPGSRLRPGRKE